MTTLDKLQRSVERLHRAVERLSGGIGKYGFANVYNDDLRLLLSERAELLATVGRLRGAALALYMAGHWSCDRPADEAALWTALRDALDLAPGTATRAALTTGEEK